jgi:hypothetical protein
MCQPSSGLKFVFARTENPKESKEKCENDKKRKNLFYHLRFSSQLFAGLCSYVELYIKRGAYG